MDSRFPGNDGLRVVSQLAVRVMAEVGIDISGHTPDHVGQYAAQDFELALTVCD